jgi:hypothetical protein
MGNIYKIKGFSMEKAKPVRIKLCGLWSKDVNGKLMLSGYLGDARVVIWDNGYKGDNAKAPDYIAYLEPKQDKPKVAAEPAPTYAQFGPGTESFPGEDIPF